MPCQGCGFGWFATVLTLPRKGVARFLGPSLSRSHMDRLFKIDFYPQDWLVKTAGLTAEQCGMYIQIISLIYAHRGKVLNDADRFCRLLKISKRKARTLIAELVKLEKIAVDKSGFITNSRCENELKVKRNLLENGAKGGRTSHENKRQSKEINGVGSSPDPTPTRLQEQDHNQPARANGKNGSGHGLENGHGLFGRSVGFTPDLETAQQLLDIAPGWDQHNLIAKYNAWQSGRDPPRNPQAAFLGWARNFTKNQRPS